MSSDKTAGQWVGTIVGAVVGFYAGGPQGAFAGASIGAGIGGLVDPPKGPTIRGPRLEDLSVQNAQYGSPLARIYGTVGVSGTVIWVENNQIKEVTKKKSQGGKGGGGGATVETFTYFGTFAVALGDAPAQGFAAIRRVWVGPDLIYNAGSNDLETIIASNQASTQFRFYSGADDQMPDPRIEAEMGVGNAPAFRGTSYIVMYDLPLAKSGNSLMGAQLKIEVIGQSLEVDAELVSTRDPSPPDGLSSYDIGCANLLTSTGTSILSLKSDGNFFQETINPSGSRTRSNIALGDSYDYAIKADIDIGGICLLDYSLQSLYFSSGPVLLPTTDTDQLSKVWRYSDLIIISTTVSFDTRITIADAGTGALIATTLYTGSIELSFNSDAGLVGIEDDGTTVVEFDIGDLSVTNTYDAGVVFGGGSDRAIYATAEYIYQWSGDIASPSLFVISRADQQVIGEYDFLSLASGGDGTTIPFMVARHGIAAIYQPVIPPKLHYIKLPVLGSSGIPLSDVVEAELIRSELISSADIDVTDLASDIVRGYRPAGVQQVRSCIGPLQMAYPFDLIMDGYQIKAVRRGLHSSVATIPAENLDARAYGDAPGIQFDQQREMDSQLPRQVVLRHIDAAREYEVNEQRSAERMSAQTVDVREIDLALVLTPDEAAQISDVEMTRNWLERVPASFRLPPEYLHLQPADVITVENSYGSFEMLLGEIAYTPDGRLECSSRPNAAAVYSSTAVGGQGPTPDGEIPLASNTVAILLDIPLMRDEDDVYGFGAAVAGESTSWPGGALLRSADGGQTWVDLQAFNAPVTMGYCRNSLGESSGALIDYGSELHVDPLAGAFESITEAQMLTGLHYCAYGSDERWEIIQFADADLQADGSYLLSTLVRGIKGTEWATGLHEDGDALIFLDDPDLLVIGAAAETLGLEREYRALTAGQLVDDVDSQLFTYHGVNLEPLSPVDPVAVRSGSDWMLSWTRRSRYGSSWWTTGVERPLGESSESYEIDILDGLTVVRTLTSTTTAVTYTAAQQTTDFGSPQTSINYRVYQLSTRVGRGYPLEHAA